MKSESISKWSRKKTKRPAAGWLGVAAVAFFFVACTPPAQREAPSILLFSGTGTSPNDVRAIATILQENDLAYSQADSSQLNRMSEAQLHAFRLLIIPGGNFIQIGDGLTTNTLANIQEAVQDGLNYLGICAGGFLAGHGPYRSLDLTSGKRFDFYSAVNRGVHKAVVKLDSIEAEPVEHYWEDGPQFAGWGDVVAKYPDGTPAIVEGGCGRGWVLLSGVHPEAPANWRYGLTFTTSAKAANAYAGTLINAALTGTPLPHY